MGTDRLEEIRAYLSGERAQESEPPLSRAGAAVRRALPPSLRTRARELATDAARPLAQRRIAELADRRPLRLHVGCGFLYKPGWVNVDLVGARVDVPWNLARGIPFEDGSVDAIFHEHLLEHLSLAAGFELTRNCARALAPGGILRIGVPDAGECLRSYAGQTSPDWANSRPTGMLAVQHLFYDHGHQAMYDAETLTLMCRAAGFAEARQRPWGDSDLEPAPDTPARRSGTLYVEAIKNG